MKIIKEFTLRNIAGECILIPLGETAKEFSGMISLSPSAEFIWQNLEKADSFEELLSMVLDEFDVEEQVARQESMLFIGDLLNAGLVELTKEDRSW